MSALEGGSRITPFLWFDNNAVDAAKFYCSIFPNSRLVTKLPDMREDGSAPPVLTVAFVLDGMPFTALNGGPKFKFTEAVSFVITCESQQEIDDYWSKLTADGGSESMCGWLKDKFGLSWQVVPARLGELLRHPTAIQALMKMKKLNIAELELAAAA